MNSIIIRNQSPEEAAKNTTDRYISVGLHPWHIRNEWQAEFHLLSELATEERVVMIGEAGLDKVCRTSFSLQQEVFRRQALLAEKLGKPLIIHCVKAWPEIVAFHTELRPSAPWIIHGFRGKPELAKELLKLGFYLSFGEHFNSESVIITPLERLCTETDESKLDIETIYSKIAQAKGITVEELLQNGNSILQPLVMNQTHCTIDIHCH
jgi:TatD DNase family protein